MNHHIIQNLKKRKKLIIYNMKNEHISDLYQLNNKRMA
jgi:hypothetical protein